jgi:asparagine synthase (glutamine-hydrolysing)
MPVEPDNPAGERLAMAREQFRRHGFSRFEELETPSHSLLYAHPVHGGPELFARRGADWVAVSGTLLTGALHGRQALLHLLDNHQQYLTRERIPTGQYALLLHKDGVTHVMVDYIGAFQVFVDERNQSISTSFLTLCLEQQRLQFNTQAVYETAFNVMPTGNDTVFRQIRRLDSCTRLALADTVIASDIAPQKLAPVSDEPVATLRDRQVDQLLGIARQATAVWGDNIQCPLSGGLDSRLVLALFRACGVMPHVYVYGSENSPDVRIAREIGRRMAIDVEVFDKAGWRSVSEDAFAEQVLSNFHETDGLVTDGGLFDNGANAYARHARQLNGALAVSGGAGEVFRNFYFLPDHPMSSLNVVRTFFCRYDPRDVTTRFDAREFEQRLAAKANDACNSDTGLLTRQQVEWLYPAFRCRAFFGKEISVVGRQGGYLLPFLAHEVVSAAITLPMHMKVAGRFEAELLACIDPELAAMPSAYGHDFTQAVSIAHRFSEWSTVRRPVIARKMSYRIRNRMGRIPDSQSMPISEQLKSLVVDTRYPLMSRFFRMQVITDPNVRRRVDGLEYLGQFLGSRIVDDSDIAFAAPVGVMQDSPPDVNV